LGRFLKWNYSLMKELGSYGKFGGSATEERFEMVVAVYAGFDTGSKKFALD
jgi:hypothetical protein